MSKPGFRGERGSRSTALLVGVLVVAFFNIAVHAAGLLVDTAPDDSPVVIEQASYTTSLEVLRNVVTVLNFVFVISVFVVARNDRRSDGRKNVRAFWFQELILKENLETFNEHFKRIEELSGSSRLADADDLGQQLLLPEASNERFVVIRSFNSHREEIKRSIVEDVSIVDSELGIELSSTLDVFQDEFTRLLEEAEYAQLKSKLSILTRRTRREFLRKLYMKQDEA